MKEQEVKVDEVKAEEVKVEEVKVEEVKKEETKVEEVKKDILDDIFITEDDTFDVSLKYTKKDGKLLVEGVDEDFDDKKDYKTIEVTLKYPDQSDCYNISNVSPKMNSEMEGIDVRDFVKMEISRFVILARKWTSQKELNSSTIMQLDPKIVKGLLNKVRETIRMDGII